MSPRVICMGEAMGEIAATPAGFAVGVGGDTFNTAVYLARAGVDCAFASAVGPDPFGQMIRARLIEEGIDDALLFDSDRETGLYAITTRDGERSFHYWRDHAAARHLLRDHAGPLAAAIPQAGVLYLSGITAWVLGAEAGALLALLEAARAAGVMIVFDGNYRPRLWAGQEDRARDLFRRIGALSDLLLPTAEDEALLWGDAGPEQSLDRLSGGSAARIVLKIGAQGALLRQDGRTRHIPVPVPVTPLDTTAAGDSFNAACLAALLAGAPPEDAVLAGHALAARVIGCPGALLPRPVPRRAGHG
ncbi:sugar kinase [Pseudooceanicola sp. CBS1P-1]|uniref:Sugar kinase n=1 Tax=Pseudooceanicola albus TaxID=2692189 RepID=A0A6L7G6G8_9RHOB|nr:MULTISPECIES: sugar kinase [Pseudooceanicola]MBT9385908.1 sugar kinase [Pseudooceanicola endophyticus]MXN19671.1 sugar kinase [Pseudooceanicola albus]